MEIGEVMIWTRQITLWSFNVGSAATAAVPLSTGLSCCSSNVTLTALTAKVVLFLQVVESIFTGGAGSTAGVWLAVTLTRLLCTLGNSADCAGNVTLTIGASIRSVRGKIPVQRFTSVTGWTLHMLTAQTLTHRSWRRILNRACRVAGTSLAVREAVGTMCTAVTPQSHHIWQTPTLSRHLVAAAVARAFWRAVAGYAAWVSIISWCTLVACSSAVIGQAVAVT